ncbi:MAG: rhodanese-like domain-containing protein [Thiotrichaceae bacterium]|nr:rhodanese-like domain-containing protein [Thiotrichaceae bacterium]PCI12559.1 MAG: hypothetical protein COB71_08600 [Thiotrichales bacterium]
MSNIAAKALHNKIEQGEVHHLIDVRTIPEFNSESIDAACRNIPLDRISTLDLPKESEIILVCASGNRSSRARETLVEQGFTNVYSLDGGLADWKGNKLPTKNVKGTLPIMRQVQIAAGILILVGTLGSLFIASPLIWLAVFVGAGLAFAGLSGWCGMAILLGYMPWNKKLQACSS